MSSQNRIGLIVFASCRRCFPIGHPNRGRRDRDFQHDCTGFQNSSQCGPK